MALDEYVVTNDAAGRVTGQGIYQESAIKNGPLGAKLELTDGRMFRYCLNGGVALAACTMAEAPAWVTTHSALATNTATKGTTIITVTNGITNAFTADQYADGFMVVETVGSAEAGMYKIKTHPAADASADCVFTLYDPLRVAFAAGTTVTLMKNRYSGVIITVASGGTETGVEVGIPLIPVTIGYYFWAQYRGPSACLINGTPAIGTPLMRGAVAGSLALADSSFKEVAVMAHTGVDTEIRPVILNIP